MQDAFQLTSFNEECKSNNFDFGAFSGGDFGGGGSSLGGMSMRPTDGFSMSTATSMSMPAPIAPSGGVGRGGSVASDSGRAGPSGGRAHRSGSRAIADASAVGGKMV
jgi:hypothetical protein